MSGRSPIAIVGMACRYPDAASPQQLWENALAQRRSFRRIPSSRLRGQDYYSADRSASDSIYTLQAAVIEGYEFDRHRFKISGSTFRAVDLAHWLALDVASAAVDDAGFPDGKDLARQSTGVLVGNTLTGEFSRANLMRIRWPYVRRTVEFALAAEKWDAPRRGKFLADLERQYKAPFPAGNEETLAGGLSNTIAGRICNYFDLKGGGYTVDGACASSLLAVINACTLLNGGELDVALAGGVDLSLDPFELVGFSRTGALAEQEMTVFDVRSQGFWPGEGCGFVTLMRQEDAQRQNRRIYATIRGWGVSSDGAGGITRPEVDGQVLCLHRAYRGLEFKIADVACFEGHGTGTAVGDATELRALTTARQQSGVDGHRAAISSIKANIGHTKAAAGIAGMIKAVMAVAEQVLPPSTACAQPHPQFTEPDCSLQTLKSPRPWPNDQPLLAAVSAMGFGGINTHVVLQGDRVAPRSRRPMPAAQDCELFLFDASDAAALRDQVRRLRQIAEGLSRGELLDCSAALAAQLQQRPVRAAVIASDPATLAQCLDGLLEHLDASVTAKIDPVGGLFLGIARQKPRIGLLCTGQGYAITLDGGAIARRFSRAGQLYDPPLHGDVRSPDVVQPAVVRSSLAAIRVLESLGISADLAVGHSLGELTALSWAGAFDETTILELAETRGRLMAEFSTGDGAMASIAADPAQVRALCADEAVAIACHNGPRQTVISGPAAAVRAVVAKAQQLRLAAVILKTTHAFHSPLVAAAAAVFPNVVAQAGVHPMRRAIVSTVSGELLSDSRTLPELLGRQIISPVLFAEAIAKASSSVDLFIEVGCGEVLSRMVAELTHIPAAPVDVGGESLRGLLCAVGAAFALGANPDLAVLFGDRLVRPFALDWKPRFFANPCESAPILENQSTAAEAPDVHPGLLDAHPGPKSLAQSVPGATPLEVLRQVIARQEELQPQSIQPQSHLLRDLHLNSLKVAEIVAKTCRQLGLPLPAAPTEMSRATVGQIALGLEEQQRTGPPPRQIVAEEQSPYPPGVDSWVRTFKVEWIARPLADAPKTDSPRRHGGHEDGKEPLDHEQISSTLSSSQCPPCLRGEYSSQEDQETENGQKAPDISSSDPALASTSEPASGAIFGWQVFGESEDSLVAAITNELSAALPRGGVALFLKAEPDPSCIRAMLASAREAIARVSPDSPGTFVVVHRGGGAALAKTLFLECPDITACVVDVPFDHPLAAQWVVAEALAAHGYCESRYDPSGQRRIPILVLAPTGQTETSAIGLSRQDVLLVTGGGKGIAAECAMEIAAKTGTRLLIVGRSDPRQDPELAANLARLAKRGAACNYQSADVTDSASLALAVRRGQERLGLVTAILHGAGTNTPRLLSQLDEESFLATLRPKYDGLRNLLCAVDADRLKLLVTFGSVIARVGLRGEADYAVANEWMGRLVEQFQQHHPACRCLNLEWSVWSGVGMGPRLASITPLMAQGISPISPDAGVQKLMELLGDTRAGGSTVVSGRYGDLTTLHSQTVFQPRRFVHTARCFFPGVELVADTEFSLVTDPYLADHVFRDRCLLPGVVGLEMMAEAAAIVVNSDLIGTMHDVHFDHPIEIPPQGRVVLRACALAREDCRIDVVVRSSSTRFALDHFTATCRPRTSSAAAPAVEPMPQPSGADSAAARLDPHKDLYGRILFQGKTFQRVIGYDLLRARQCIARISQGQPNDGLGERDGLILGDPAARDAAIHAIQACIPHSTVLPVSIAQFEVFGHVTGNSRLLARERQSDSTGFVYDLSILSDDGQQLLERWSGLRLQIVSECKIDGSWPAGLLLPYLERRIGDLIPNVQIGIDWETNGHVGPMMRRGHDPSHRPDGKPDAAAARQISSAYFPGGRLTCASGTPVAVDAEPVNGKPADHWAQILGAGRMGLARTMSESCGEPMARSAARVWCAAECLAKLSAAPDAPLTLVNAAPDGWTLLCSGQITIASFIASVGGIGDVCLAFAAGQPRPRAYEFTVRVGFDEVNRMGTVNFQTYFNWQARCREAFLHDHVPTVLRDLHQGLLLVTTGASCEYLAEVASDKQVLVRMTLGELGEHSVTMNFEYVQTVEGREVMVARGRQTAASMNRNGSGLVAAPVPEALRAKLADFTVGQVAG